MRNRNDINRLYGLIFYVESKYLLHAGLNKFDQRQNKENLTRQMIHNKIHSYIVEHQITLGRPFPGNFTIVIDDKYCDLVIEVGPTVI